MVLPPLRPPTALRSIHRELEHRRSKSLAPKRSVGKKITAPLPPPPREGAHGKVLKPSPPPVREIKSSISSMARSVSFAEIHSPLQSQRHI